MLDVTVLDEAEVSKAAAVAAAQVAAYPVVVEPVVVGTGVQKLTPPAPAGVAEKSSSWTCGLLAVGFQPGQALDPQPADQPV